ncbi:MAG: hypothetical protein HWE26_15500 [Alteromonadaceae bacterium]|nr:hypothetical protein [Alteromonadaceae bacterium]
MMLEEDNNPPPVAFSSYYYLSQWAQKIGDIKIEKLNSSRAVRVYGWVKSSGGSWWYDQVWVDKNYSSYRSAMLRHVMLHDGFTRPAMNDIDADHLAARSILEPWPKAWVCLFPVPRFSNRPFGGIEKALPKVRARENMLRLSPIMLFKALCGFYPRNLLEANIAMQDVSGQVLSASGNEVEKMLRMVASDMSPYFKKLK